MNAIMWSHFSFITTVPLQHLVPPQWTRPLYPHPPSASLQKIKKVHSSLSPKTCATLCHSLQHKVNNTLKQLQKNYTFKYLFVVWHQEQKYHKNINHPSISLSHLSLQILPLQKASWMNSPLNGRKFLQFCIYFYTF